MTAIAVINIHSDPKTYGYPIVISDTLLSEEYLNDKKNAPKINLPGTGSQNSFYFDIDGKPRRITRLARKPIVLDNCSGILTWAGSVEIARLFREKLAEKINLTEAYTGTINIDKNGIDAILAAYPKIRNELQFFSITYDSERKLETLNHKLSEFQTNNFGKCYVGGTGANILKEIIENFDKDFQSSFAINSAQELTEYVCSKWLYDETTELKNQLIKSSSGGFLDWYRLSENGVHCALPRVDIHVEYSNKACCITRLYHIEALTTGDNRNLLKIDNFIEKSIEIPSNQTDDFLELTFSEYQSAICEHSLYTEKYLSEFVSVDCLKNLFSNGVSVENVSVILQKDGKAILRMYKKSPVMIKYIQNNIVFKIPIEIIEWRVSKAM